MTKQQLKVLVTKTSKSILLELSLVEDHLSMVTNGYYWLIYKVKGEDILLTITPNAGVLNVSGKTTGTYELEKICELDRKLNEVIKNEK